MLYYIQFISYKMINHVDLQSSSIISIVFLGVIGSQPSITPALTAASGTYTEL